MSKFERLTTTNLINDKPTLKALCESCGESGCIEYCDEYQGKECDGCPIQKAFERLSSYEDSGLSPAEVSELKKTQETCEWSEDDEGNWRCSKCAAMWMFESDGPKENSMNNCPECGRKIVKIIPYQES